MPSIELILIFVVSLSAIGALFWIVREKHRDLMQKDQHIETLRGENSRLRMLVEDLSIDQTHI